MLMKFCTAASKQKYNTHLRNGLQFNNKREAVHKYTLLERNNKMEIRLS